jgi:Zn-dependent M28 family amino/carboxypeptidase
VVAILSGVTHALRDEAIIVGAHHDHLGRGGPGATSDSVYPGADDNASGVAALLRAAEILQEGPRLARSLVFVTFTAEEMMMLGSKHFVSHPPVPLDGMVAMINLDMVGRLDDQPLIVSGTGTAPWWPEVLRASDLPVLRREDRSEVEKGSDHLPFFRSSVPTLYLHNGPHPDYHQPSDRWEEVQIDGVEKAAQLVAAIVRSLAERPSL